MKEFFSLTPVLIDRPTKTVTAMVLKYIMKDLEVKPNFFKYFLGISNFLSAGYINTLIL